MWLRNHALRNELSIVAGLLSAGFWATRRDRLARGAALLSLGLRLMPGGMMSFRGATVVITGGSRGLGLALAEEALRQGANVVILARDVDELTQAQNHLQALGLGRVMTVACDVTERQELNGAFNAIMTAFGSIDVLINNAGSILVGPFESMEREEFAAQMRLHFQAVLESMRSLVPYFKKTGGGRVVNICSVGGKIPVPHMAPYCASKFALAGLSETLAAELAQDGIVVTTVYPGLMRTGSAIQAVFKGDYEKEYGWFASAASAPLFSMDARKAAERIIKACREGRKSLALAPQVKAAEIAHALLPETFMAAMATTSSLLPQGKSRQRHTGAESAAWLEKQLWGKPLTGLGAKAQKELNQRGRNDADFNAGL